LGQTAGTSRFDALVWPHAAAVLRTARFLIHDPAEADDVAQETMVKAFRALDAFVDGTDVRAWLMTILRNTRTDHLRRRAAHAGDISLDRLPVEPAGADAGPRAPAGDDHPAWDDPQGLLQQFGDRDVIAALRELPEEIRWTLLLVDVEGLDHADAAAVLGVPTGTVKSRAHRGRRMLRERLLPVAKEMRLVRD
jgi:RNA polymerase sigma-70 factor (ECF subfamily)